MKTPDETKRALVTCTELVMPKEVQHQAMLDALAYIQQLERERDAAVADLKAMADKVRDVYGDEIPCFCCKHDKDIYVTESGAWSAECPGFSADDCFEWRGVKEE